MVWPILRSSVRSAYRAAGRGAIALLSLAPTAALASGDPRLIWWMAGGVATHVAVGLVLLRLAVGRWIGISGLMAYAFAAALTWFAYLDIADLTFLENILFMIVAPLAWLLLLRRAAKRRSSDE